MESIPKPEVLDADRILRDDREDMTQPSTGLRPSPRRSPAPVL